MKTISIKQLKKRAWKYHSLWVRKRSADYNGYTSCFTCGVRKHYKDMNAGHYIHNKLDYDDVNIQCQCVRCNQWLSGNLGKFSERLHRDYGQRAVENLREEAEKKGNRYTIDELEEIIKDRKQKVKELENGRKRRKRS